MILHLNWPFLYDEHGSKNRAVGSKQLDLDNKSIAQFVRKDSESRFHHTLLQIYVSKLQPTPVTKDLLYCKPMHFKDSIPSDGPWYTDVPIGHNILHVKLKALLFSADTGPTGKSNHSLRATGISRMYNSRVPEKLIVERSGHLRSKGVQAYERTTTKQQQVVCGVLAQKGQTYGGNMAATETILSLIIFLHLMVSS